MKPAESAYKVLKARVCRLDRTSKGHLKALFLEGQERLRVPRAFREPLGRELVEGMEVRVWLRISRKGKLRMALLVPLAPLTEPCSARLCSKAQILVCTSKSCCRRGGGDRLARAIVQATQGREDIQVRRCGCLKACGKGPNIQVAGQCFSRLDPCQVPDLVDRLFPLPVN